LVRSYISPKAGIRKSPIHGKGLFAIRPIKRGEIIAIKGGHIMDEGTLRKSGALSEVSFIQLAPGFYIGAKDKSEVKRNKIFVNHSCAPNVGFNGQVILVAMRDVKPSEELTFDWAMFSDESYIWKNYQVKCNCGKSSCRKTLTPHDWRMKELQRRYRGYFATFVQKRIDAQKSEKG
jgi:SET domain-containing protein